LSGSGEAVAAAAVAGGEPSVVGPIAFSNGMGAPHLARRTTRLGEPAHGLVLDTGGSTTAITPLVDGQLDPAALATPERHLDHRLRHGKLTWIGAQTTPLEALAGEAEVAGRRYPVIPRGVTFDCVSALLHLLPAERAGKLSLFQLVPDRELALRSVADAVNLDANMATEPELLALAERFRDLAIARLAEGIAAALETVPETARRRAMAFGLGARGLARPALIRAGVPEDGITLGEQVLDASYAELASCYGACHLGLERIVGRPLAADLKDLPATGAEAGE
jgi:uncharacterized hydantoinase/oxoprolinase family protein